MGGRYKGHGARFKCAYGGRVVEMQLAAEVEELDVVDGAAEEGGAEAREFFDRIGSEELTGGGCK